MIGSNEIHLNQQTMIEAVQMYLDSQFAAGKAPKVQAVEKSGNSSYGDSYIVKTQEPEAKP